MGSGEDAPEIQIGCGPSRTHPYRKPHRHGIPPVGPEQLFPGALPHSATRSQAAQNTAMRAAPRPEPITESQAKHPSSRTPSADYAISFYLWFVDAERHRMVIIGSARRPAMMTMGFVSLYWQESGEQAA